MFSEDIERVEQIGGWRNIKRQSQEDFERLVLRVEESKIEVEQEQEELQPDELVQVNFEGEMRGPPKGLTANLLPFQVEGVSWMYHQEVKVPELHGGILADGKLRDAFASFLRHFMLSDFVLSLYCPSFPSLSRRDGNGK